MPNVILVPVDGSDKDGRALAVAADLARLADASLTVVRVTDASTEESRHSIRGEVRAAADRVALAVPRGVTSAVIEDDDVPAALLDQAAATNAMAVVMATRAPEAFARAIHGSVADHVAREARQPVVLVPPRADFMSGHEVRLRRGVVPLDGSPASLSVVAHLLAFANARELDLVLLQVVHPTAGHRDAEAAETLLNEVAAQVRARGATAEARVVEARDPAAVIVAAIRQDLAEFIAMSTRGAGGVERLAFGSVATAVVRKSEVPVLLVTSASNR